MSKTSSKTTKEGGSLGSEGFNTCVIATGTKIEGNFKSAENIRLDGEVIGDLSCEKKLVLGPGGKIHGNVSAREAVVMGTILGDMEVIAGLMLDKTASVKGNVRAATIGIEEGAFFTGNCTTTK